jgi:hypothetical protein
LLPQRRERAIAHRAARDVQQQSKLPLDIGASGLARQSRALDFEDRDLVDQFAP